MKDETKEILNKLLEYFKESNINHFGYEQDKLISYEEAQILLDYITNLQENKRLQKLLDFEIERNDLKQERIDKAIEFIDKYCIDDEFYINLTYKEKAIIEVKKILKGSVK